MTIGPPEQLTCPMCGKDKYILSILSGNTFNATYWSDSKRVFPMLKQPSPIQRCPHCGAYFFYQDSAPHTVKPADSPKWQKETENGTTISKEWKKVLDEAKDFGELSFRQINEAFDSLYSENLSDQKKDQLLAEWLFLFNDEYGGRLYPDQVIDIPEPLMKKQNTVLRILIQKYEGNALFVAEMYRELGEFDKCVEFVTPFLNSGSYETDIARQFIDHAKEGDRKVFRIEFQHI